MPATGYIQVYAYSSFAQLPLQDVAVTVTSTDGTAIAMVLTDRSGRIAPIAIPVPDKAASQTPDTGEIPFTAVDLQARLKGYQGKAEEAKEKIEADFQKLKDSAAETKEAIKESAAETKEAIKETVAETKELIKENAEENK